MSFIHLQVYSAYSLLTSTAKADQLVASAKQKGFKSIAMTDRNVMYGAAHFYKECRKQGIKPILGLTADVLSDHDQTAYPIVLLAKNHQGFQNLLKISSSIQTIAEDGLPIKWLKAYSRGLYCLSPGIEGEIERHLVNDDFEQAKKTALCYKNIFEQNHFYFSLQNHGTADEKNIYQKLKKLSGDTGIPMAATNAVYYIEKQDAFAQECLLAIRNGEKLEEEGRERLEGAEYYMKTASEMANLFADDPDALLHTIQIANDCNVTIEFGIKNLPKYPIDADQSADELLEVLCRKGLEERYENVTDKERSRLEYELSVIQKMNFSDYFLIVADFMKYCRENRILTGPGRGSAAGSIVAYVLFITDVDPIGYGLLFERFLNPDRISMPDIDIDFPDHRRDEVIQYVAKKYGKQHVAQIITFGTMAAKAVLRDVGRAFGLNPKELDQLSKTIPNRLGVTLNDAMKESTPLREFMNQSEINRKLCETALKLEGLPRHSSTHAAGVVISEQPLVQVIPVLEGHEDVYLTQYTMEHLEDVGLLKMDFLGLRNLSLIENILLSIKKSTGKELDIKRIPLNDAKVFKVLSSGETTGIFQLESSGMRSVLKRLQPTNFEDIVAVNALYRPGPMENIPLYIDRKHGKQELEFPHPDLEPILKSTHGVIVYQEQIMQIAAKMAGFTLGEADLLRRAVSKKQKEILDRERAHFVQGAKGKGYTGQTANDIYDYIVKFANYGFNRSHAVAYSLISYQLAYLKTHYPLHFMAALLTSVIGNESRIAQYVNESKQMDITVLAPSINKSVFPFTVEKDAIRYSIAAVKGVGANALKEIFRARRNKYFTDLFDFCVQVSPKIINRKLLEMLVHSGCFDEFGEDRATLLASLDVAIEHADLVHPGDDQFDMFTDDDFFPKPKYTEVDPIRTEDKLFFEKEALGLYLSAHPVSIYEAAFPALGAVTLRSLTGKRENTQISSVVYLTEVKKIRTKKGEAMAFLSISDQTGDMEAVVFPKVFNRSSHLLSQGRVLFLHGNTEERNGKIQFIVRSADEIDRIIEKINNRPPTLYLKLMEEKETKENLYSLKELISQNKGDTPVVLYYESTKKTIRLGENDYIHPSKIIIERLKNTFGKDNVILRG
ncbi:DNA polymerase III subunit alpha [Cytobacillus horneckiae]|uniref:DNA polymerase III subunit alpha n=1 Tax=Cytobacillus horneckiae TaxID=549687 RepID=A0A2N0ZMF5_9BACI|nr:DNA polymerase III subunit alpha [Cytobacillus horneckiae]MEC1155054.1 DNA polymerase III subunit alpha [Cytobacillus horneckiae]MED2936040.1 DNA polymerase III subunit alpha [Cytobacillus horneckiae]PKG30683.1 DNA polymerase III subunit alpha [Cytobacillus horneckiae]